MSLLGLAAAVLIGSLQAQDPRIPVPDEAALKGAQKEIRELFKEDLARRDRSSLRSLAEKLLREAVGLQDNPVLRFALLREAKNLAAEGLDLAACFAAVDKMGELYALGRGASRETVGELKLGALALALRSASAPEDKAVVAQAYFVLLEAALGAGDCDTAIRAAKECEPLARVLGDPWLAARIAERIRKDLPELKREADAAARAEAVLATNADSPEANFTLGRFRCCVRSDWPGGLPLLMKGDHAEFREAAQKDLAGRETAAASVAAGDAWWALMERETVPIYRKGCASRAREWYASAVGSAEGATRAKVEKRLEVLQRISRVTLELLEMIDPSRDGFMGEWKLEGRALVSPDPAGQSARLLVPYQPPEEYDMALVVERKTGTEGLHVGLVCGGTQVVAVFDGFEKGQYKSGLDQVDGLDFRRNVTMALGRKFANNKPYLLEFSVRKDGVTVSVDGKPAIRWQGSPSRLSLSDFFKVPNPRALFLGSWESSYRISRICLTPVTGQGAKLR